MNTKQKQILVIIAITAVFSSMFGAIVGGFAVFTASEKSNLSAQKYETTLPISQKQLKIANSQIETTITEAVENISPAVVTIIGTIPGKLTWLGMTPDTQVTGSGVIISPDGYLLTNDHVIEDTNDVWVVLSDGKSIDAQIVGREPFVDLAVLKIEAAIPTFATIGNSDTLKPGETVIAIGSPLGDFKNSVTVGVVSATGRTIDTGNNYLMEDLIQTDAAINQGNSGGPLLNLAGEVIGINTLVVRRGLGGNDITEGLGFAIPSNAALAVAEQIIQKGYVARPFLGIRWQPITPRIATAYQLPVEWGVYVTEVITDSPAMLGGLQRGDIITRIGDFALDDTHSYLNVLYKYEPYDTTDLEVIRRTEILKIHVTFGENKT